MAKSQRLVFPGRSDFRQVYPDKTILQGLEWNVPSHEHASVCILTGQYDENPNCSALAEFEYKFDSKDKDDSKGKTFDNKTTLNWTKSTTNDHAKAVAGVTWLQTYHKDRSWIIPAHPEREEGRWTIEALRDLNNADQMFALVSKVFRSSKRSKPR